MNPLFLGYDAAGRRIRLTSDDRKTHMHVIGSSGSGKSKFLEWMIRGDLRNRQGFCLIDPHGTLYNDVLRYCAHDLLDREIILLNLAESNSIIGFNPFQRAPDGEVSVQVDRRIAATMRAWDVRTTDQTPTLERTLRLIYTVMIEGNLGLRDLRHLINYEAREIRSHLLERLQSELIQQEWQELLPLGRKEWQSEILSAKNRLFRLLTSDTLARFMGLPGISLNLDEIIEQGKVLLVNLATSDTFSSDNARVFGALLVNQFFEAAKRREKDERGRDPKPYYLYIDEFQNFVTLDIGDMLDQVRKRGLFTILAHQRFGQLGKDKDDQNLAEAVLINCRIKAVFGGLTVETAKLMAQELFIAKLDPKKIKAAIYQTKFWPQYSRDKVYTKGSSRASSSGFAESVASGSSSSRAAGEFFQPTDWLGPESVGTSTSRGYGSSEMSGSSSSYSDSSSESESEADIPIFIPVPFQELSSVQYYTPEEQLMELTAALKEQFDRHCFIKILQQETQPMLVPFVKEMFTTANGRRLYEEKLLKKAHALPSVEVDRLLEAREHALLKEITSTANDSSPPIEIKIPTGKPKVRKRASKEPVPTPAETPWDILDTSDTATRTTAKKKTKAPKT